MLLCVHPSLSLVRVCGCVSQEERLMYTGQDGPRLTSTDPEFSPFQHRFSPSAHRFSPSWDHFNTGSKWSHDGLYKTVRERTVTVRSVELRPMPYT